MLFRSEEVAKKLGIAYYDKNIINQIAEKSGLSSDYILKDRDDVLNIFIHGDMPEKIQRITRLYKVEEKKAVKMMADTDRRRMTNYNFYTEQKWGKASNYTLCLNSSLTDIRRI